MPDDQIPVISSSDQVPDEVSQATTVSSDNSQPGDQAQPQSGAPQPGAAQLGTSGQPPTSGQPDAQPGAQGQPDQQGQQKNPTQQRADANQPPSAPPVHPEVQKAGILHNIAQTLAGGPRFKDVIDPNTGTRTRERIPLSKGDIGMAIAMSAISGSLAGLGARGPNAAGQAAGLGFQQTSNSRMQAEQAQSQQAQADFARHAQVFETNMRMHSNAMSLGKQDFDTNDKYVQGYSDLYKNLQENNPKMIKGVVNEDELSKYHATKENAIPVGVVKRPDPNDPSKQAVDQYGAPQWELQYAIVDPSADVDLTPEEQEDAHKYGITGFIDSDGEKTKMPKDARTKLGTMLNVKAQVAALKLTDNDLKNYYNTLNNKSDVSKTPVWGAFADTDKLADAITDFEGGNIGDRNMRNNNPGNIKATSKDQKQDSGGFRIFDSPEEGKAELSNLLQRRAIQHPDWTIEDLVHSYSPDSDPGNGKGQEASYASFLRKRAGLPAADSVDNASNQKYDAPDLAAMVRKDPTLAKAVQKFMPMYNHTGDIGSAVDELAKSDPSAAGKIANLYGGRQAMQDYATQRTLSVEAQKDKVKADAQLTKEAQSRQQKEAESYDDYQSIAKAIAGDPSDPGSGDLDLLDKVVSQRTKDRPKVLAMIKKINPNFNMDDAVNRIQVKKDFTEDKGKSQQSMGSFNTFLAHTGDAIKVNETYRHDARGLNQYLNQPITWWDSHSGKLGAQEDLARFKAALKPAQQEFVTFLNNNHALTESDKKLADSLLDEHKSPSEIETTLKQMASTAAFRLNTINDKWKRSFNRDFPDLLNAESVQTIGLLNEPNVNRILGHMQSGGLTTGSSNGRGVPGKTVNELLGRGQNQQPNQQGQQSQFTKVSSDGKWGWNGKAWVAQQAGQPAGQ